METRLANALANAKPDDQVVILDDVAIGIGEIQFDGLSAPVFQELVKRKHIQSVKDAREMLLGGLLYRSTLTNVDGVQELTVRDLNDVKLVEQDLPMQARKSMVHKFELAQLKGLALIIRTEKGRVKAIIDGLQEHIGLESLCLGLVEVGAFYPTYVTQRQIPVNSEDGKVMVWRRYAVPLHFEEKVVEVAGAREVLGRPLPYFYVDQALRHFESKLDKGGLKGMAHQIGSGEPINA